jgi:Uma2 family endonuclease
MKVDQFLDWTMAQPDGPRYELVAGYVVAMAPERAFHARRKARIGRGLTDAIGATGLPCEALPDGMTVKIDEHTAYEPDAVVHCGEPLPDDAVIVPAPVIVVEVLSPRTATRDTGRLLRPAERPALPDRENRSANRDPSPSWRRRRYRDPCRDLRCSRSGPAGHRPRS